MSEKEIEMVSALAEAEQGGEPEEDGGYECWECLDTGEVVEGRDDDIITKKCHCTKDNDEYNPGE